MNSNTYLPVLLLRLLMILCLLCLSWDFPFDIVHSKLSLHPICSILPRKFLEALRPRRRRENSYASVVAGAFKIVGDPLVIVASSEINFKITHPDTILLDLRSFTSRNEIMKILFPGKSLVQQSAETTSKTAPNLSPIRELSDTFEAHQGGDDGKLRSILLRKKAGLEEHMSLFTTAMAELTDQRSDCVEDKDLCHDATRIVEEMNAISSLFRTRDFYLSKIMELLTSLEARQPQVDALLSQLKGKINDANAAVVSDEDDHGKISDINVDGDDMKMEDSTNPSNEGAACSQGKGKNKKKNKQKKGRGGKKK